LTAAVLLAGLTWFVGRQMTGLLADLPNYSHNIKAKVKTLRELGVGSYLAEVEQLLADLEAEFQIDQPSQPGKGDREPQPVVVRPVTPNWIGRLPTYLGSTMVWLGALVLVLVL